MSMKRIFISYSHKDEAWKDRLVEQIDVLQLEGHCTVWHDRDIEIGSKWYHDIIAALDQAQIFILLISPGFLTSTFIRDQEIPRILARREQGGIWIIPLVIKHCTWKACSWLKEMQLVPKDGQALEGRSDADIDKELAALAEKILARIKTGAKDPDPSTFKPLPPDKISTGKLPVTGKDVFGREGEIKIIDRAWEGAHTHLLWLTAWGGAGKTALVNYWLNRLAEKDYGGAHKVYAWSFYSQGAAEGKQASADEFFQETLAWFDDPDPKAGSSVDKGRRLVELIRKEKTLLILDGIEPLQYPPGEISGFDGRLKDAGLKVLLKELAASQPGLCLVSSRQAPADLADKIDHTVQEIKLEELSAEAGVQLLKSLGATGADKEIKAAVKEYDGHALALTLLGNYLHQVLDGDIRQRDKIPRLVDDQQKGPHAHRVMAAYETWLAGKPELNILRLLGLFDRPVDIAAIAALKAGKVIPGLTDQLIKLTEADWHYCLGRLQAARLLAVDKENKKKILDCHPLIREYFADKVKEENPSGWLAAHTRLYHYYKDLPGKELPDTLAEMEPLFAAVAHGCAAGLHQTVLDEVYWPRICREKESYNTNKLGAFGSDLACVAHFFTRPWTEPAVGLDDKAKAEVLNWAGFSLRPLGRLTEAQQPMQAGLDMRIKQKDWTNAAIAAGNLSELLLTLGRVEQAVAYGKQAVDYADKSEAWDEKMTKRTTLAAALHQAGHLEEAEKLFLEAEARQKKEQPTYPFLYSLRGFRFCELLLDRGQYAEVLERAEKALEIVLMGSRNLLDLALNKLSLAQAQLQKIGGRRGTARRALTGYFDAAVAGLRESGNQDDLPRGLLARAECYRLQGLYDRAQTDLDEALEIVELGNMDLYLVDYHLEAGRLCQARGQAAEAQAHFQAAQDLIAETGYLRRDREVE